MSQKPGYLVVMGHGHPDRPGKNGCLSVPSLAHLLCPWGVPAGDGGGGQSGGVTYLSGGLDNLSVMLARFSSPESVSEFWWSEDYRAAYRIRK